MSPAPTTAYGAWSNALDAIEASLDATDDALAAGTTTPSPTSPAFPHEPLPADLAARAQSLLARTQGLEDRAVEKLEGVRLKLQSLPVRRPRAVRPRTGRLIDVGA